MNTPAYRFIFEEIHNPDNFTPLFFKNPRRVNSMDDVHKCQALALSLFIEEAKARVRFQKFKQQMGNKVYKTIGSHLAVANITQKDGVNSTVNADGHFSNHPFVDCDYKIRFVNIGPI